MRFFYDALNELPFRDNIREKIVINHADVIV